MFSCKSGVELWSITTFALPNGFCVVGSTIPWLTTPESGFRSACFPIECGAMANIRYCPPPPPTHTYTHFTRTWWHLSLPSLPPSLPPPLSLSPALFFYGSCSCFHHLPWLSFLFSSHPSLSLTLSLWWNKLCKAKDPGTRPTSQAHRLPFDIWRDKNLKCQPERKADKKCIVQKINKIGDGQHLGPWSIRLATCTTLGVLALSLSDTALSLSLDLLLWFKNFAFFTISGLRPVSLPCQHSRSYLRYMQSSDIWSERGQRGWLSS